MEKLQKNARGAEREAQRKAKRLGRRTAPVNQLRLAPNLPAWPKVLALGLGVVATAWAGLKLLLWAKTPRM